MKMDMNGSEMIAAARLIAKLAHKGQKDKAGIDYFTHPEAVAAMLETPEEKVVGYLHDTVEDTDVTVEEIRTVFGDEIADAVALMTHADGVPYMDYVKEIGKNPLARKVKLADLTHNMDISRIPNPTQRDYDRIEKKYKPAYEYLKGSVAAYNNVATSERRPK
jgi:(p)ppGpp synthase/HD superfamily hydrolase